MFIHTHGCLSSRTTGEMSNGCSLSLAGFHTCGLTRPKSKSLNNRFQHLFFPPELGLLFGTELPRFGVLENRHVVLDRVLFPKSLNIFLANFSGLASVSSPISTSKTSISPPYSASKASLASTGKSELLIFNLARRCTKTFSYSLILNQALGRQGKSSPIAGS